MTKRLRELERRWTGKWQDLRDDNTISFLGFLSVSHSARKGQAEARPIGQPQALFHTQDTSCLRSTRSSIFKVPISQPNHCCRITGTLASKLIHTQATLLEIRFSCPPLGGIRPRPSLFWLSSGPWQKMTQEITSAPTSSTSRNWAGGLAAPGWRTRPDLHCKGHKNVAVIGTRAQRSKPEPTC